MGGTASPLYKRALVLGAVVVLVFACGGIDDNELKCEEAVSHLENCCPDFDAKRFQCDEEESCDSRSPDFYESASECLLELDCDQIRARGKCAAFIAIANEPYPNRDRIQREACQ